MLINEKSQGKSTGHYVKWVFLKIGFHKLFKNGFAAGKAEDAGRVRAPEGSCTVKQSRGSEMARRLQ